MKRKISKNQETESAIVQNRCIWMTAGVISFKLCPLDYDCEQCDFDEVMRSQVKLKRKSSMAKRHKPETLVPLEGVCGDLKESLLFFTFSPGEVDEESYLHPAHLWAHQVENGKWRLGIGKLLAYVLPPPVKVEVYDQETKVVQNQLLGKIHTQTGIVPLTAPLSGFMVRTNSRLSQQPELVQHDPDGEGWLAEIDWSQDHSELENLFAGLAGKRYLEEEARHLNFLLKHRGIEVDNIGETLPDGGVNIKYLHQILPSQVCLGLSCELIISGKQAW
jgi:glycine cleavage system H protein